MYTKPIRNNKMMEELPTLECIETLYPQIHQVNYPWQDAKNFLFFSLKTL